MDEDFSIRNARIVLAEEVITGSIRIANGRIAAIDAGSGGTGIDFAGDYLLPGLIELHTDQLEGHYRPRPGVFWDPLMALQHFRNRAFDRSLVAHVAVHEIRACRRFAAEIERYDRGARREQAPHSALAKPRIAATNECDLACRIHFLSRLRA